jgi:hypothetical protein
VNSIGVAVNLEIIWKLFPEEKFNFNEFFMTVEIEVCAEEKQTMQIIYASLHTHIATRNMLK